MQIRGIKPAIFLTLCCTLLSFSSYEKVLPPADSSALLHVYEDSLRVLQYEKVKPHTTDKQKLEANERFTAMMKKVLSLPGSFDYPFDSLTTIAHLTSPDKQFRIYNWNVPKADGTFEYFGFIQSLDAGNHISTDPHSAVTQKKGQGYHLYLLVDKSSEITNAATATCTADKWLGMLYYKIIPEQYEDKTIYVLLAWQGYNKIITHKVIDVISFNNKGEPSFGKSIFKKLPPGFKGSPKRIIFQYSATAYMSIDYDSKKNQILFDHLAPIDEGLVGQYQYYAPSFQVDALNFKGSGWEYMANVDARNKANPSDKNYHDPEHSTFQLNKKPIYTPH